MRLKKTLRINNVLGRSGYSRLLSHARALGELDAQLQKLIPAPLNEHCRILSLQDGVLTLAADSPVWTARLRFHGAQLVKQFSRQPAVTVRTVRVRVRPPHVHRPQPAAPRLSSPCSPANAEVLQQTASTLSDPDLKSALLRLARRYQHR